MDIRNLEGSIVALVTPFKKDGSVDFDALERLIDFHLQNGTDAILTLGTTGESATMTDEEDNSVVKFVVDHIAGRIPVIACPKLDNNGDYAERLTRLFAMRPASVTLLRMSVPCCAALEHLARQAQEAAGSHAALQCHTVHLPR